MAPTWQRLRCARIWATTAQTGSLLCDLFGKVSHYDICELQNGRRKKCLHLIHQPCRIWIFDPDLKSHSWILGFLVPTAKHKQSVGRDIYCLMKSTLWDMKWDFYLAMLTFVHNVQINMDCPDCMEKRKLQYNRAEFVETGSLGFLLGLRVSKWRQDIVQSQRRQLFTRLLRETWKVTT